MQLKKLIIDENFTVLQAMQNLDITGCKIVFIAPENELKAVITDSDIRKFILKGGKLDEKVCNMANYKPKTLSLNDRRSAKEFLLKNNIDAVPLLDEQGKIADIVFISDLDVEICNKLNVPVVIMAGGVGSRLYPYTKILPKPLIPIGEIPIMEHIINRFVDFGCDKFNIIVNYKKGMIKSYFAENVKDYKIDYIDEDIPLGTGGGLSLLKNKIDETFFLTNCDILIDADYNDIYKYHKENNNKITMVCAFKNITIPYGVINLDDNGEIKDITEKPQMSFLTNAGMYLIEPEVIDNLNDNEKIDFTDIMDIYRNKGDKIGVYPISENSWMDMGQLEELDAMRRKLEKN